MGQCDLCGEKAGLFQRRHSACATRAHTIEGTLRNLLVDGVTAGKRVPDLQSEASAACEGFPFDHFQVPMFQAVNDATSQLALATPLSNDELDRLFEILRGFGFDSLKGQLAARQWWGMARLHLSNTLWHVLNGNKPYYDATGRMQFNIGTGEYPIISTGKATYAEERTVNIRARTYGGLSVPIGAGMYYHVGQSQGHTVSGLEPLDVGEILITNRALYFGGQKRNLRVSLATVLRYQPYIDGVGICESYGSPKVFVPDYSGMDTGWFFYNLLTAITSSLKSA